jgi:serine/threonine-protein kinase
LFNQLDRSFLVDSEISNNLIIINIRTEDRLVVNMQTNLSEIFVLRERYQITAIVGHGGMGKVYLAEDLRLPGRLCAVKEVRPEPNATQAERRQEQAQFLREASLLAQLDHPNLPKVSDFFSDGGLDYLVMDYVPGKNLKELIDDSRMEGRLLNVDVVSSWSDQIMDAVAYLHQQTPPVLHRDVKPSNIKLTPAGRIKLVDFGLAKIMAGDDSSTITVIQGRGTAYYTPLEQYGVESEHTDVRSDIYALGATLYHLYSGQAPPEAKERFLNPSRMKELRSLNRSVSQDISNAIHWALEMHPDKRPASVKIFRQAMAGEISAISISALEDSNTGISEALGKNIGYLVMFGIFLLFAILLTIL